MPHDRRTSPPPLSAWLEGVSAAAAAATSLAEFRSAALTAIAEIVAFDAALFHALSPRVPLSTAVIVGIDRAVVASSLTQWDDLAVELGALRELANAHGAASDEQAFPGARARARFERRVSGLLGHRSLCIIHLTVRRSVEAAIVLLARRRHAFSDAVVGVLRRVAPTLAVADALHARLDRVHRAPSVARLECRDERLTGRQREIVELVALGHTNPQIAAALGLSVNTLRNHLARIFARVGASNRADLVRVAVLGARARRSTG